MRPLFWRDLYQKTILILGLLCLLMIATDSPFNIHKLEKKVQRDSIALSVKEPPPAHFKTPELDSHKSRNIF